MVFTQAQIQDMLSILTRYQLTFILNQLGPTYLTAAEKALLLAAGIDVNKYVNKKGVIEHAFYFGILADAIGDDRAKKMDYPQFQKFLASKNYIPLTAEEEYALQQVKNRAYTDITNLGARMRSALSNSVLRSNQQQSLIVQKMIRSKTIKAIELRSGARALAADLANTSQDWEVDWLRIAYYLTHEAYNAGRAQDILKNHGASAEVYFDVYEGACKRCKELYLEDPDDPDSKPIVFKLDDIIANGNNIGRKSADWKPTISPTHPYCRCTINYKDPDLEWDADLRSFVKVKKKTSTNPRLQGVKLNIKVTKGIDQETEDMLQKAHVQGDIHPNGKWYWESSAAGGKGDWRVIKKTVGAPTKPKSKFAEMTEEEMMADYDRLDGLDSALKKELSQKYGIESKKAAEIGSEILRGIQEKRKAKDTFAKEDLRWFNRLYPSTGTFATLKNALDSESEAFVKFVADEYKSRYDKVMSQRLLSMADKARITDYNNIVRYLNEKKNSEDDGLQTLIKNLTIQTDVFKTKYIKDTEQYATAVWERARDKYREADDEAVQLHNNHGIPYSEKKDRLKELSDIKKKYSIALQRKAFFVARVVTDAKKTFEADIRNIADRIRQKGIDESKIQVKPLKVGGVGIDMMIGDEKRALYARAIVAAVDSMYMRPHYRFIITEKDDYKSWQS